MNTFIIELLQAIGIVVICYAIRHVLQLFFNYMKSIDIKNKKGTYLDGTDEDL